MTKRENRLLIIFGCVLVFSISIYVTVRLPYPPMPEPQPPSEAKAVLLARNTASENTGIAPGDFTVRKVQKTTWPDTSLGCPEEGMAYAQVTVDGYRIVLVAPDTQTHRVHTGGEGAVYCVMIVVDKPQPMQLLADGFEVSGKARGFWYFEASFPTEVLDVHGQPLGNHYAEAQGEWMVNTLVPFKGILKFREPQGMEGTVVFHNDNPSGLPENDENVRIPVRFYE
jgi:hypothetical protein